MIMSSTSCLIHLIFQNLMLHYFHIYSRIPKEPKSIIHKINILLKYFHCSSKSCYQNEKKIKSMIRMRILTGNTSAQISKNFLQFFPVHSTKSICDDPENQPSLTHDNKRNGGWKQIKVGSPKSFYLPKISVYLWAMKLFKSNSLNTYQ